MTASRCSDISEASGESISATVPNVENWLLVEVRGTWPRDVSDLSGFDDLARRAATEWLESTPLPRLMFIRRPGRRQARQVVFAIRAAERDTNARRFDLDDLDDLADVDLATGGVAVDSQLVLVCAHGTRDPCCALRGSAVFGALGRLVPEDAVWLSSHQGGHRFAANVLVLPAGVGLGRLSPANAVATVGEVLAGRIPLAHYRGRTAYTARVQAAEHAVRESEGLVAAHDLTLVEDDGTHVRFVDKGGNPHAAVPQETAGPSVPASCGTEPEPQKHVVAQLV